VVVVELAPIYPLLVMPQVLTTAAGCYIVILQDEGDKVVVVERGDLVMVFNFHPTTSYTDYRVGCNNGGKLCLP
jgi:hypothetical protein